MSDTIEFKIDGVQIEAKKGLSIMEAADSAGIYIPRLCAFEGLTPHGSCRVCTVFVNGRPQAACTTPATKGLMIENDSPRVRQHRRNLVDMLMVEGNHYCMYCEKSGMCELQAVAYRLGITAPKYPFLWPNRQVDASHPDILLDHNRCILCGRCVAASQDLDGKNIFQFVGRSIEKRVSVNAEARLSDTNLDAADEAVKVCPVGAILKKHVGYQVPIGQRRFDKKPIGSEIEESATPEQSS